MFCIIISSLFIHTVDNSPPTITCPSDIGRQIACGNSNTQVDLTANAFDNCGTATVVYSSSGSTTFNQQSQSSATMNVGTSQITATATDNGGRTSSCTYTVTVTAGIILYFVL